MLERARDFVELLGTGLLVAGIWLTFGTGAGVIALGAGLVLAANFAFREPES